MSPRITLPALFFLTSMLASGVPEEKPSRQARLMAVGEAPPFRQQIRDGIRYELDPPPGSLPPGNVIPGFDGGSGEILTLRLGTITSRVKAPAGAGTLVLRRAGEADNSAAWATVAMPASGDFLVYLFRNPTRKTWEDAMSVVVPDGAGTPAGTVRITNLFPQAVRIVWGKEVSTLERGGSVLRKAMPGAEVPFQILAADSSGQLHRYYSGGVIQNPGERGWVTIYRADGLSSRRPLKVSILREPVMKKPETEKKRNGQRQGADSVETLPQDEEGEG